MPNKPRCAKCGCEDIGTRWFDTKENQYRMYGECRNDAEHLHRHCCNCHYEWCDSVLEVPDAD